MMRKLTGTAQASFIPGRYIIDNVIMAQEIIHSLLSRKGRRGGMMLKLDLEKDYDRVDWVYLRKIAGISGFSTQMGELIMDVITHTSLKVCWNGVCLPPFTPSRGLRQGDPLSPYLFVLCMEVVSQDIA